MNEKALRITELMSRFQKELRCGICCSTFKDPIISTCHHVFCRECIDACFAKKRKLQCPICRQILDKRSCKDSYQLTTAVNNYLKVSEAFKKDVQEQRLFTSLPKEVHFMESQKPMDDEMIAEKGMTPDFVLPMMPRKRRPTKVVKKAPEPPAEAPPEVPQEPSAPAKVDIGCQTLGVLESIDIEEQLQKLAPMDPLDALFQLMPSMKQFMQKNIDSIVKKFGSESKENRRVSFCQNHEERQLKPSTSFNVDVVADSEPEEEDDEVENKPKAITRRFSECDSTIRAEQDESQRIEEELSRDPVVVACSRVRNYHDDVELCADFYRYFSSNAVRFSDDVNSTTTHLVMMNSDGRTIPQKSLHYVYAIAHKCLIVSRDWLQECVRTRSFVAVEDYTILDETGQKLGWQLAREPNAPKLFDGLIFMILRRFAASRYLDYKKIIELVQLCNGKIFDSSDRSMIDPKNMLIVFSSDSHAISEVSRMEKTYSCTAVTCEWILDSICEFRRLPYNDYLARNKKRM